MLLDLIMTIPGTTPNPCPTVALAPVPVYVTTENPAVVLALTDDVIDPAVLLTLCVDPFPVYSVAAIATRPSGTANVVAMIRC